jgi:hypothetical protein
VTPLYTENSFRLFVDLVYMKSIFSHPKDVEPCFALERSYNHYLLEKLPALVLTYTRSAQLPKAAKDKVSSLLALDAHNVHTKPIINLSLNSSPINSRRIMEDGGAMMAAHSSAQCCRYTKCRPDCLASQRDLNELIKPGCGAKFSNTLKAKK